MEFYVGTSGWTYDHWAGTFYPDRLSRSRWFAYYCSVFNALEVNATFYRKFADLTFVHWYERSPEGFRLVCKIPRIITHRKYLRDCDDEIHEFVRQVTLLKEKLGCLLLQLPPGLKFQPELLKNVLGRFPENIRVAVEFRNQSWFVEETYRLLENFHAACVNVDSPRMKLNVCLPSFFHYLRFHGRNRWYNYNYSDEELSQVAEFIKGTSGNDRPAFIFFNNDFEAHAPRNALMLKELLDRRIQ